MPLCTIRWVQSIYTKIHRHARRSAEEMLNGEPPPVNVPARANGNCSSWPAKKTGPLQDL